MTYHSHVLMLLHIFLFFNLNKQRFEYARYKLQATYGLISFQFLHHESDPYNEAVVHKSLLTA